MKGHVYYNSLPYELRELVKLRYEEEFAFHDFNDYLNHEFDGMSEFIAGGFIWMGTPEGHDYWVEIANGNWKVDGFVVKSVMKHTL